MKRQGSSSFVGSLRILFLFLIASLIFMEEAGSAVVLAKVKDQYGQPVQKAIVFVHEEGKTKYPPRSEPYIMDQINKKFVPHVLPIIVGSQVLFPNRDNIFHHLYSFSPAKRFEIPLYKGEKVTAITFEKVGVVKMGCNIHDWMKGIILALPTPYFAETDKNGNARLKVPSGGSRNFAVFHEWLYESVDNTIKSVPLRKDKTSIEWKLDLKKVKKRERPVEDY